jgi:hypothetical protein
LAKAEESEEQIEEEIRCTLQKQIEKHVRVYANRTEKIRMESANGEAI